MKSSPRVLEARELLLRHVDEYLELDDPIEIRQALMRLTDAGYSEGRAKEKITGALARAYFDNLEASELAIIEAFKRLLSELT